MKLLIKLILLSLFLNINLYAYAVGDTTEYGGIVQEVYYLSDFETYECDPDNPPNEFFQDKRIFLNCYGDNAVLFPISETNPNASSIPKEYVKYSGSDGTSRYPEGWRWSGVINDRPSLNLNGANYIDNGSYYYIQTVLDYESVHIWDYANALIKVYYPNGDLYEWFTVGIDEPEPEDLFECPEPMIYVNKGIGIFNAGGCLPNPFLTEDECLQIPNTSFKSSIDIFKEKTPLYFGVGCYNSAYAEDILFDQMFDAVMSSLPLVSLAKVSLSRALQNLLNRSGKLWEQIRRAFAESADKPNLVTHEPLVRDIKIDKYGQLDFDVIPKIKRVDDEYLEKAYQQFLRDNGYIDDTKQAPPLDINPPKYPEKLRDYEDMFYKGLDSDNFDGGMFANAQIVHDQAMPNNFDSTLPSISTTIPIRENLTTTDTMEAPILLQKASENTTDGTTITIHNGKINFNDGVSIDYKVTTTKKPSGSKTYGVKTSYPVSTPSGNNSFNSSFTVEKNPSGDIIDSEVLPSTITKPNEDGSTSTTPNEPNAPDIETDYSKVNLKPIIHELKLINQKLEELKRLKTIAEKLNKLDELKIINQKLDELKVISQKLKDWDGVKETTLKTPINPLLLDEPLLNTLNFKDDLFQQLNEFENLGSDQLSQINDSIDDLSLDFVTSKTCSCPYSEVFESGYFPPVDIDVDLCKITCKFYDVMYWVFYILLYMSLVIAYFKVMLRLIND